MTKAIISRIEKRERRVVDGELLQLAVALGVSMEWLVEITDDPKSNISIKLQTDF